MKELSKCSTTLQHMQSKQSRISYRECDMSERLSTRNFAHVNVNCNTRRSIRRNACFRNAMRQISRKYVHMKTQEILNCGPPIRTRAGMFLTAVSDIFAIKYNIFIRYFIFNVKIRSVTVCTIDKYTIVTLFRE